MKPVRPIWAAGTLAALTGLNLLNYLDRQILPAVLTQVKSELHWSDSRLGFMGSVFMLGYFLTSPIFGYLGDRVSRKMLIASGVLVWSIGTFLTGWAHGFGDMVLFRILVGLGEASYGTISPGWIADLYPKGKRNNAISFFYLAIPVGSALGYLLGGAVAAHWGWRAAFECAGAPGVILAGALLFLREPERGASDSKSLAQATPQAGFEVYAHLLKYRHYVLVVLGYTAQTFALGGFSFWAPTFLQRVHGMGMESANQFFSLSLVVTGLLATLIGGWLATAWQRKHPAGYSRLIAFSSVAAVPAVLASFTLSDLSLAKLALVASMALIFLSTGPVNTLILESVPPRMRAAAMAASIFAIHLGGDLWSPKIIGMISDRVHSLQTAALWSLPAAIAICAAFWTWLAIDQGRTTPAKT